MDKMEAAKALMKKFKQYYDEETDTLKPDAPEEAKKAYSRFTELLSTITIKDRNPGYLPESEAKKNRK